MKTDKLAKKSLSVVTLFAFAVSSFGVSGFLLANIASAATPWDVSGAGDIIMNFESTDYTHNINLTQSGAGVIDGTGTSGAYAWNITSGSIVASALTFDANYTATADAVTPQTVLHIEAVIAGDGSLSGTWSDNYNGGSRSGSLSAAAGFAVPLAGSLAAQDFGVWDASGVKGYSAGFILTDATFLNAQSVVIKLYAAGDQLLQTNTLTGSIPGNQISSPFDVFGTFDYVADGYWSNTRATEYGQTLIPTKVIATVVLENGKEVTAENTILTGDPSAIFPLITTNDATAITSTDATLNGTNGSTAGTGHSFWASTSTFSTASPTLPAGVYTTADLGAINASTAFSAPLSSVVGMPAVTPSTTYYFAAWSLVGGTWYPGAVLSFTTSPTGYVTTNTATAITSTDATLNGTNGDTAADNTSFWWGPSSAGPFTAEADPTAQVPLGWSYHPTGTLAQIANAPFSHALTSLTPDTEYHFVAWSHVGSTWYPGEVLSFTTANTDIGGDVVGGDGALEVTSIDVTDSTATADGTFENGWEYVFNVTVPSDEQDVAMKFADWLRDGGGGTIPAANNIRISSAQADNGGATIMITAANVYSADLHMTGDLDSLTDGMQVEITVEVRVPSGTPNGAYGTSWGIRSN